MRYPFRNNKTFMEDAVWVVPLFSIAGVMGWLRTDHWLYLLFPVAAILGSWLRTRGNTQRNTAQHS
jgi:hypothetical protein